jgi:glycosyltransferase involved in cell wall biosynthesis
MERTLKQQAVISIVVPVYNEEESISPLYDKIIAACSRLRRPYEIIFVDDGSCDRTFQLLKEVHARDKAVRWCASGKTTAKPPLWPPVSAKPKAS